MLRIVLIVSCILMLSCGQTTPTVAPPTPAALPTAPATPSIVEANAPPLELPPAWMWADWEGLALPVPPNHHWDAGILSANPSIKSAGLMIYDGPQAVESPSGMGFEIFSTNQTPQQWLDAVASTQERSVDSATIKPITIDDHSGLVFNPLVTGTGLKQSYVIELGSDQLLIISTDIAYPDYLTIIEYLQLPTLQ